MLIRPISLIAVMLTAATTAVCAGPCTEAIDRVQASLDAKIEAAARSAPSAPESPAARLHRQPTPASIAEAVSRLGQISPDTVQAVRAAMARAREGDRVGNRSACEQALADAQRALGP
jgi:hypothetical protein